MWLVRATKFWAQKKNRVHRKNSHNLDEIVAIEEIDIDKIFEVGFETVIWFVAVYKQYDYYQTNSWRHIQLKLDWPRRIRK